MAHNFLMSDSRIHGLNFQVVARMGSLLPIEHDIRHMALIAHVLQVTLRSVGTIVCACLAFILLVLGTLLNFITVLSGVVITLRAELPVLGDSRDAAKTFYAMHGNSPQHSISSFHSRNRTTKNLFTLQ